MAEGKIVTGTTIQKTIKLLENVSPILEVFSEYQKNSVVIASFLDDQEFNCTFHVLLFKILDIKMKKIRVLQFNQLVLIVSWPGFQSRGHNSPV